MSDIYDRENDLPGGRFITDALAERVSQKRALDHIHSVEEGYAKIKMDLDKLWSDASHGYSRSYDYRLNCLLDLMAHAECLIEDFVAPRMVVEIHGQTI